MHDYLGWAAFMGAWVLPTLSMATATIIWTAVFGWIAQYAKAHKNVPTPLVHLVMLAVGAAVFVLAMPPTAQDDQWWQHLWNFVWAPAGVGSALAGAGLAKKTDSITK